VFSTTLYWSVELSCCCQYTKIYSVSWTNWIVWDDVIIFNRKAADGWDRCRRMHAVHALIKKRVSLGSRINLKHHAWKFRSILNSNKMAADQIVLHSFQFHSCKWRSKHLHVLIHVHKMDLPWLCMWIYHSLVRFLVPTWSNAYTNVAGFQYLQCRHLFIIFFSSSYVISSYPHHCLPCLCVT
jgi:hypothetical protein